MKLDDLSNMSDEGIASMFENLSKEEIIDFCIKNDIPYKKYYSKAKLLKDTVNQVSAVFMFRRIAGK